MKQSSDRTTERRPHDRLLDRIRQAPWAPYVIPFALFMILTALAKYTPEHRDLVYIAKTILVAVVLWAWRRTYAPDMPRTVSPAGYGLAVVAGLMALAIWVLTDPFLPRIGTPTGFNPFEFDRPRAMIPIIIGFRLAGAALVVPVMEELFWRSFILRYIINPDFKTVPLGTFSLLSFSVCALLFGLEHFRVIQGILAGMIYAGLVIRQKSLRGCILAHGVTNLGLGIYVLWTGNWHFW